MTNSIIDNEVITRRGKYLKIIQSIADNITYEDFCILLDIFYIEILGLEPNNNKEKK